MFLVGYLSSTPARAAKNKKIEMAFGDSNWRAFPASTGLVLVFQKTSENEPSNVSWVGLCSRLGMYEWNSHSPWHPFLYKSSSPLSLPPKSNFEAATCLTRMLPENISEVWGWTGKRRNKLAHFSDMSRQETIWAEAGTYITCLE